MSLDDRWKLWRESDGKLQEPWEVKCKHPECNVMWTETTGNTLFWCACLSEDEKCECERLADKGFMWCINHIPSFLRYNHDDQQYYCEECFNLLEKWNDSSGDISHKGTTSNLK